MYKIFFTFIIVLILSLGLTHSRAGEPTPARYVALLSQSGTDNPTAIVLENTLPGTPTYIRSGPGTYGIELDGEFPEDKTWVMITQGVNQGVDPGFDFSVQVRVLSPNEIDIFTPKQIDVDTPNVLYDLRDGMINKTAIEIRVYP